MKHFTPAHCNTLSFSPFHIPDYVPQKTTKCFSQQKDLPVLGRAQGGDKGSMVVEESPIDWTFRPADLQGVQSAFAVYVTGNSMLPKYKEGDLAYIHPSLSPRKGRYVLVETKEHKGLIKQFIRWDNNALLVKQYNPDKEFHIPREDIRQVMLVIGSLDS